jgi:hypothetical protein
VFADLRERDVVAQYCRGGHALQLQEQRISSRRNFLRFKMEQERVSGCNPPTGGDGAPAVDTSITGSCHCGKTGFVTTASYPRS